MTDRGSPHRPKLIVVVKSHRPLEYLRMGLLETTLSSIQQAFPTSQRMLLANDASDGSARAQCTLAADNQFVFVQRGGPGQRATPGDGAQHVFDAFRQLLNYSSSFGALLDHVLVTSDDDMLWRAGAEERLRDEWAHALHDEPVILCGLLEPEWAHNTPRESIEAAHGRLLVRDSVPGAAWTVHGRHVDEVAAVIEPTFGYDTIACARLRERGHKLAAIDLCEHIGEDASTHDNHPHRDLRGTPIDEAKWGLR